MCVQLDINVEGKNIKKLKSIELEQAVGDIISTYSSEKYTIKSVQGYESSENLKKMQIQLTYHLVSMNKW